ncbi:MAG TPA: carboxypeptidase regulatory-like domain-containing protein [Longimicrobiales bacterium]|nr:carboxypeptidase regulatory-like domain-containing protein [Longimicrobiales bacterium]
MNRVLPAIVLAMCLVPPLLPGASAQSLVVEVTAVESGAPLAGAFVSLLDDEGRVFRSGLTNEAGRFVFAAADPGPFRVRAEMIGRVSRVSATVAAGPGDTGRVSLDLRSHAIPLAEIRVDGDSRCRLRPDEASVLQRVWDEARTALAVQSWAEGEGLYELEISTYERDLDAEGRRVERETRRGTGVVTRIPFASLPPDELLSGGFVRRLDDGGYLYYGPDATVLLSDPFLDTHCFRLTRSAERPGTIGLAFEPAGAGDRPDIRGTFWLDEGSGNLEVIEYQYARAPYPEAEGVAGGRVEFEALPDGGWMIQRWAIRAPLLARQHALAGARDTGIRLVGIRETGGEVLSRAERGSLRGVVWDSTRAAPLTGASVRLSGTPYATVTDRDGSFLLDQLPPGVFTIAFSHPRLDSLGIALPDVEAEVTAGRTAEVALAIPSRATILAAFAQDVHGVLDPAGLPPGLLEGQPVRGAQGVQGRLVEHGTGQPIRTADIILRAGPGPVARGTTDERGFFRLRVPRPGRYLLTARALGYADLEGEVVEIELDRLSVLEVRMAAEALELAPLVVTADRRSYHLEMEGFYRREREYLGVFMRPELLERRMPRRITDLFFGVGGTQVIEPSGGVGGRIILFRGSRDRNCFPMVYVDRHLVSTGGIPAAGGEATAIDDVVFAADVLAIEVYRSPAEIPSEFHGPNAGCGVVVLWTRRGVADEMGPGTRAVWREPGLPAIETRMQGALV